MQDTELYTHLLGLEAPWKVVRVIVSPDDQRVDVWVDHPEGMHWPCPECKERYSLYDHAEERTWRHLDSCHFKTLMHARTPRVNCPKHGVSRVLLPWAEPLSRFTLLFECVAITVLKEADVEGATRILCSGWDETWGIMQRAVARGLAAKEQRVCRHIGIDEKAVAKGQRYMTLVCDIDHSTIEYVGDERDTKSLDGYFMSLPPGQLGGIEAVAMDMWEPFIASTMKHVPGAADKIVFDRYHIATYMGKAVDTVRKLEHRAFLERGASPLTGSKYLWLYAQENLPERHRDHFRDLIAADLKTGRAWAINQSLRHLWSYSSQAWAEKYWKRWYFWATHSRLQPVIEAAKTIQRHIRNVLTYFKHRITNAVSEGLNSKIQKIKQMACGFRNRENFKTAIYFHCGGLQLYPLAHWNAG